MMLNGSRMRVNKSPSDRVDTKLKISLSRCDFPIRRPLLVFVTLIALVLIFSQINTSHQTESFQDLSHLKPSIALIVPQYFEIASRHGNPDKPVAAHSNLVAVINNIHNDHLDLQLRNQYKQLSLQVRDSKVPITGELFFEHIFDYFPDDSSQQHLIIPLDLDRVSQAYGENSRALEVQQLIVSVRPHNLSSGFGAYSTEFVSSSPIPIEFFFSKDGKRSFGLIQTDKPIYKPNEKVRIRALMVNEDMRPIVDDEFRLSIKNPQKMTVEEIKFPREFDSRGSDGGKMYFDHTFEFPPEPMLGLWSAHLNHGDPIANDSVTFTVREYVLPPFKVDFEVPDYILPSTETISGQILAKHHYGKPVRGEAHFRFGYKETAYSSPKWIARSKSTSIDHKTGRVKFKLGTDKIKVFDWFPGITGYHFVVEATVTELATGHREVAQESITRFIRVPYTISFSESIKDFRPGLLQQLKVRVVEMPTERPAEAGLKVVAKYEAFNGTHSRYLPLGQLEASTDSQGQAKFDLGPISDDIETIEVTLNVLNQTKFQSSKPRDLGEESLGSNHHILLKHKSTNGWILLMNKTVTHLNVGDQFESDLLIRDAIVIPQKIFYIIVARGQMLQMAVLNLDGIVRFTVTESMVPAIRIVLFAMTQDSIGLLTDSMRLNVDQNLSCGLNLTFNSYRSRKDLNDVEDNTLRPDTKGRLLIQSRPGDSVSLIGVDSAISSVRKRGPIESSRLIQRIKKLDSGCGFGGGRDSLDVFLNAGLMMFRDATQSMKSRSGGDVGSFCFIGSNKLDLFEDTQLGYYRPQLRSGFLGPVNRVRSKRSVDSASLPKRYKRPIDRLCCELGILEDLPQRRNCTIRAQIVDRYMSSTHEHCSSIYLECCNAVYGEQRVLSFSGPRMADKSSPGDDRTSAVLLSMTNYALSYSPPISLGVLEKIESETLIRKDFRETWLFDIVEVNEPNGKAELEVTLPHSMTSWSIFAMSLNRQLPICVMKDPLNLVTFQEIFLHVAMPYKVVQGEQIDLVATVYNYSPQELDVYVYMYGVEDLCSEAEPGERSERRRVQIKEHSSQAFVFPIIPLKVGQYPIKVLAISSLSNSSDIVESVLKVVPKGRPVSDEITFSLDPTNQQRRTKRSIQTGNLVDEIDASKGLQRSIVRLTPTRDSDYIVPQTQECIVSAIGDKLGQTVQTSMIDIENLIRLPHGCGEQVMIYLGPTLYTARYLSSINKLTGDLRWRAIRYIQSGYKRILNFRDDSGAFSAFSGREPSVWLTAFVAKMLCQTEKTPHIGNEVHVDSNVINTALVWLIGSQSRSNGNWIELNPVYHREMLGGILKENALTAFVTLALNECTHHASELVNLDDLLEIGEISGDKTGEKHPDSMNSLQKASHRAEESLLLSKYRAIKERNPYVLALTAYALSFSRPREAAATLNDLMALADKNRSRNQISWRGSHQIETAAYALQAIIELVPILVSGSSSTVQAASDALGIANWLASQRSFTGAFESTQDTIVALEALAKYSQLESGPNRNFLQSKTEGQAGLVCNVTVSNRTRKSIEFDRDNAQILQTFKLDSLNSNPIDSEVIEIVTSGNGLGTMSVKLKYNVMYEEDELCPFYIDSSIEEWRNKTTADQADLSGARVDYSDEKQMTDDEILRRFDPSLLDELGYKYSSNGSFESSSPPTSRPQNLRLKRQMAQEIREVEPGPIDRFASELLAKMRTMMNSLLKSKSSESSSTPATIKSEMKSPTSHRISQASRRSAPNTPMPAISKPLGIPNDAKMNDLSFEFDFGNQTRVNQSANQQVGSSNRLVLLLQTCVRTISSRRDSEMAVIEIGMLSGFKPNEADLKEILNEPGTPAMKYEFSSDRSIVFIYMHYIPWSGPFCIQFRQVRDFRVYNLQSGYIRAYEYYSKAHSCASYYTPSRQTDLIKTICDSSNQVCQCAAKSLCPATGKLDDLGQIEMVNVTSARDQLKSLVCSKNYDFVSIVQLKNIRELKAAKLIKLYAQISRDIRGNLSSLIEAQRKQNQRYANRLLKVPEQHLEISNISSISAGDDSSDKSRESLNYLNILIDSGCVREDPMLVHFAHPSMWKQGGEKVILFGRYSMLEKRYHRSVAPKSLATSNVDRALWDDWRRDPERNSSSILSLEDSNRNSQYSTQFIAGTHSILHDIQYQASPKTELRKSIRNLVKWLEMRSKHDQWTCESDR